MLLEPPGPHVPARHGLSPFGAARAGAAAAAVLLAALSQGDAVALSVALALAVWRPIPVLAVAGALGASSLRWGSTSLEAWSGAQAVLGPAGVVGPAQAAVSAWSAAVALVLSVGAAGRVARGLGPWGRRAVGGGSGRPGDAVREGDRPVTSAGWVAAGLAIAAGTSAATVVAGAAPGGEVGIRVLAALGGAVAAWFLASGPSAVRRWGELVGVLLAAAAVVLAAPGEAGRSGIVDGGRLVQGLALVLVVVVASTTAGVLREARQRRATAARSGGA